MGLLLGIGRGTPATAQFEAVLVPDRIAAQSSRNLYLRFDPEVPVDGWIVTLPADWRLQKAYAVAVDRLSELQARVYQIPEEEGRYLIEAGRTVATPHDLVFEITAGGRLEAQSWRVTPFTNSYTGRRIRRREHTDREFRHQTVVEPESPTSRNGVGLFTERSAVESLANGRSIIDSGSSFTVEFWLRTRNRNALFLSTWNGDPNRPYPVEVEIDVRGRLIWYWGRPGWHQSLASQLPVADGSWRHVALVHSAERHSFRMLIDGTVVDSLYADKVMEESTLLPVFLGGRQARGGVSVESAFEGRLDELRIWNTARTISEIQTYRKVPLRIAEHLQFVEGFDPRVEDDGRTGGITHVRSRLMLLSPVSSLQAEIDQGMVNLHWSIASPRQQRIIVERSADAVHFLDVGSKNIEANGSPEDPRIEKYTFNDPLPSSDQAVWYYRLRQHYESGAEQLSGVVKVGAADSEPTGTILIGSSPNPFNNATVVAFSVREPQEVHLSVWSVGGNLVDVLADRVFDTGIHRVRFTAEDLPTGIYFLVLRTSEGVQTVKMTLMK